MRFQKRKSLLGSLVRLNMSGSGLSVSVGIPGARVTIPIWGKDRPLHTTVGLPGTGLSHTQQIRRK